MLFSSTTFIFFYLPTVIVLYYVFVRKSRFLQNILLLVASLLFYAWGEPKFVFVMMTSIVTNWLFGLMIQRKIGTRFSKLLLGINVFINLFLLFIFKYLGFSLSILHKITGLEIYIPSIKLPIGISFFTFQAMSYVIDVYRQNGVAQTNLLNVGLYISFFPQLIAGPIVRYETVANEIQNRLETCDDFFDGFARFVLGLSKKVLLANSLAIIADQVFDSVKDTGNVAALFGWLGALAYTLQIYYDFSGYSDMAIGLGRMFGFHYQENFNYPYVSTSISEFWRRWHMSLGTWFRDYLYIPLGGNRCSKWRNMLNLFCVWVLTGLWHGANYTFLAWGMMYFGLLFIEKNTEILNIKGRVARIARWIYTMFFVMIGWVIFRSDSLSEAFIYLKNMFLLNNNSLSDGVFVGWISQNTVLLLAGIILCTPILRIVEYRAKDSMLIKTVKIVSLCFLFLLSLASLIGSSYNPFIYFNF